MNQLADISQMADEQVIPLIIDDQNLFVIITSRYKLKLFNYIKRSTNIRDEDAEDLLQDIFLKVYLNLNSFNRQMKFSSWIYAIARNMIISHYRKISVRPGGYIDTLDDQLANQLAASFDLAGKQDQKQIQKVVSQALYRLKSKYRDVIILKYIEEKSYQEISDIIRKPLGTIGSMLNRAKDELRKNLNPEKIL